MLFVCSSFVCISAAHARELDRAVMQGSVQQLHTPALQAFLHLLPASMLLWAVTDVGPLTLDAAQSSLVPAVLVAVQVLHVPGCDWQLCCSWLCALQYVDLPQQRCPECAPDSGLRKPEMWATICQAQPCHHLGAGWTDIVTSVSSHHLSQLHCKMSQTRVSAARQSDKLRTHPHPPSPPLCADPGSPGSRPGLQRVPAAGHAGPGAPAGSIRA